jgi:hypothetical protein
MATISGGEALGERRHVTVVVRLLLHGTRLAGGEVVDAEGRPGGRFSGWDGMTAAIRDLVGADGEGAR